MSIKFIDQKNNNHDSLICELNLNILAHAQIIELNIGSRCGGHGHCGGDKIQIPVKDQKYFSPVTEKELNHLTKEEIKLGFRLACQVYPNQNNLDTLIRYFSG